MKKRKSVLQTKEAPQEMAAYLFHQGTNFHAYEYLGMHIEGETVTFRVWAPNADYVSVVGEFNQWNPYALPMKRVTEAGVWEVIDTNAKEGQKYKYFIKNRTKTTI